MKRCLVQFAAVLGVLLLLTGIFNLVIDPLYHYHAPVAGTSAYFHNQVYQTSGAALHFTYDSAIVGTSMTENFRSSWFEELGLDTIKLSYSGGHSADIRSILDDIYESGNDVRYLFIDVNDYQLTSEPGQTYVGQSDASYGDGVLEGAEYLLNSDVLWMSMGRTVEALTDHQPSVDAAYTWEDPALFSEEAVKESCRAYIGELKEQQASATVTAYDSTQEMLYCAGNLANILPVIEAHPETEFVFFYPPYSILYWQQQVLSGRLEAILEIYGYSMEQLLQYDNVRVFYFQDEEQLIANLDNYRDVCHHTPQINRYIFDCIKNGDREITLENRNYYLENMYRIASQYPYEEIWEE